MTTAMFTPSFLKGEVTVPPSKSDVHRAVLCAALAKGISRIEPVALSKDIKATIDCVTAMGAKTRFEGDALIVDGREMFSNISCRLHCCESGSTLRFVIPIAAAGGIDALFTGEGRLPERPIGIYTEILPKAGVKCITSGGLPFEISGQLQSGDFSLPGNISSQFITGLLLSLPLLSGNSRIILTTELESEGYVTLTLDVMKKFGVEAQRTDYGYFIKGNQQYTAADYKTQGDWSQAAFFICAGAINGDVTVKGVSQSSSQRDKDICGLVKDFCADISWGEDFVKVRKSSLHGIKIDARQIPDIVPVLAVTAAYAQGETVIYNAERLRIKESDRLQAISQAVNACGGDIEETEDGLIIRGVKALKGGKALGCNDHRIVMSMATAAVGSEKEIYVTDPMSINKSYPDFFKDYNSLGGKADVIDLG